MWDSHTGVVDITVTLQSTGTISQLFTLKSQRQYTIAIFLTIYGCTAGCIGKSALTQARWPPAVQSAWTWSVLCPIMTGSQKCSPGVSRVDNKRGQNKAEACSLSFRVCSSHIEAAMRRGHLTSFLVQWFCQTCCFKMFHFWLSSLEAILILWPWYNIVFCVCAL